MKVLVSGPVLDAEQGWTQLRDRVLELHQGKHGPFDLLIIVPATSAPNKPDDVHFPLQTVTESGIYGGQLAVEVCLKGRSPPVPGATAPVDVLVTEALPQSSGVPNPVSVDNNCANWAIAAVPRYHFAGGSQTYFQRAPYRNGKDRPPTRLIAMPPVGSKEKWMHALNVTTEITLAEPSGTTDNPYTQTATRSSAVSKREPSDVEQKQQFFFASESGKRNRMVEAYDRGKKPRTTRVPPRLDCWFCLASSSCEKHLLASIFEEAYVALPKGGIRKEHVLIVPISHESSFAQFLGSSEAAINEVVEIQTQIEQAFAKGGFAVLYTDRSLTFGKAPQQHGYLECLPVPLDKIQTIEKSFLIEADAKGIKFEPVGKGTGMSNRENLEAVRTLEEYLFVQLPGGKAFVHRAQKASTEESRMRSALLQFGRSIVCNLLNCPERSNWKSCIASKSQETAWTETMSELLNVERSSTDI